MIKNIDAFGENLLAQYKGGRMIPEIVERDDGYIDTGSDPGDYFSEYKDWAKGEQRAIGQARGRILEIGCAPAVIRSICKAMGLT